MVRGSELDSFEIGRACRAPFDVVNFWSLNQILAMIQTLLADRLKIAVHGEGRQAPVFLLTVGKNGQVIGLIGEVVTRIRYAKSPQKIVTKPAQK